MLNSEVFAEYEPSPSEIAAEILRRDEILSRLGPNVVQSEYQDLLCDVAQAVQINEERDFTPREAERFRLSITRVIAREEGDKSRDREWSFSSRRREFSQARDIALDREGAAMKQEEALAEIEAAAAARKPKTPRELEERLRTMGFSKSESRSIVNYGWTGAKP